MLGTILLVGACTAPFLNMLTLPLSTSHMQLLDLALWIVEALLYLFLGWLFSRRMVGVVMAFALGFTTRILASMLIFLLVHAPFSALFSISSTYGLSHLLAIIIAVLALALSFRSLLMQFGLKPVQLMSPSGNRVRFSFENAAAVASKTTRQVKVPLVLSDGSDPQENGVPPTHLHPPDDFPPVLAKDDITGTIDIPASVILESVPEARHILNSAYAIPVRIAFFVPQLPRATVWLTWKQAFEKGVPSIPNVDTARLEPEFFSRWIRIPARYYVTQIPRQHFQATKTPPAWMKLREVEQEADIKFNI